MVHPSFSLTQLESLSYRDLQQLCRRPDVQSWRHIRANSSAEHLMQHLVAFFQCPQSLNSSIIDSDSESVSHASALDISMTVPVVTRDACQPTQGRLMRSKLTNRRLVPITEQPVESTDTSAMKHVAVSRIPSASHRRNRTAMSSSMKAKTLHERTNSEPVAEPQQASIVDITVPASRSVKPKTTAAKISASSTMKVSVSTKSLKPALSTSTKPSKVSAAISMTATKRAAMPSAPPALKNASASMKPALKLACKRKEADAEPSGVAPATAAKKVKTQDAMPKPTIVTMLPVPVSAPAPLKQPVSASDSSAYTSLMNELNSRVAAAKSSVPPQVAPPVMPALANSAVSTKPSKSHRSVSMKDKYDAIHRRQQQASKSIVDLADEHQKRSQAMSMKKPIRVATSKPARAADADTSSGKAATIKPSKKKTSSTAVPKTRVGNIVDASNKENTSNLNAAISWIKPKAFKLQPEVNCNAAPTAAAVAV